jgi:hypothetical protein
LYAPGRRYSIGTPPAPRSRRLSGTMGMTPMTTSPSLGSDLGGIFAACRDATVELELAGGCTRSIQ